MAGTDSTSISIDFATIEEQLSASQILSRDLAAMLNVQDTDMVQSTQKVCFFDIVYRFICALVISVVLMRGHHTAK